MKGTLTDKVRIQHILDAISEIEVYLKAVNLEDFLSNSEKRFATIKQIEIIGEACNQISSELKDRHSEIEWAQIRGFRNISIHEYFGVNLRIVWNISKYDLPLLKNKFTDILNQL